MEERADPQAIKEAGKMEPKYVEEIIQLIPKYVEYIYPGFLLMYLYQFFKGKDVRLAKENLIAAICMSYVMKILPWNSEDLSPICRNIGLIATAVGIAFIGFQLTKWQMAIRFFRKLGIYTTFAENSIDSLLDEANSAWLCVYLKDSDLVYEGSLGPKELESGKDRFITLEGFYKYQLDSSGRPIEPYIEDHACDYEEKVVVRYDDIKLIEKRNVNQEDGR